MRTNRSLPALLVLVLLVSPTTAAPSALRIAWWSDGGFPTPFAFSTLGPAGAVRLTLIYDTLLWKDGRGLIPWLAQSWRVSADGLAYAFTLEHGVRWHDGRPLTADDIRFTFDYYRRHPFRWVDTSVIRAVEVRDRHSVVIHLTEPFAPFLEAIAAVVPIIPAHVWRGIEHPEREQDLRMAVGSGPFRLTAYARETGQVRLTAFDGYFKGAPVIPEIQYLLVPQERQVLAIQTGQVDLATGTTYDVLPLFAAHPYIRVMESDPLSVARLVFNLERAPTNLRAVRQAVAYAIDRRRLADVITRGPAPEGSAGVVPPGDPWYTDRVQAYPYDPQRAVALLRRSGYADRDGDGWLEDAGGTRLSVDLVSSPNRDAPIIQQMLRDAGIEVRLRVADPASRAQLAAEGRFQMLFTTHIGSGGDPDYLRTWFTGAVANEFAAGSRMRSPEYRRLAERQRRALDGVVRRRTVADLQVLLSRELPSLPLYYRRFFWMYDGRRITPVRTRGGLLNGIPLPENKLAFLPSLR